MHYNLINEAMSCKCSTTPVAGMMGTMFVGSDRYMAVCVKVLSPKRVIVNVHGDYKVKNVDGIDYYDGDVEALYEHTVALPSWVSELKIEGEKLEEFKKKEFKKHVYSLRKNGRWMPAGRGAWHTGSIHWGVAEEYLDPSF